MTLLEQPPTRGTRAAALERIQASMAGLAPAQRLVAERVLADPGQAIALSIGEFADLCGVAQPTVSRFCRNVGFASYAALRLGVAADFAADGAQKNGTGPRIGSDDGLGALSEVLRADATVADVVEALRSASRVEIWPSQELAGAGELLAAALAELDIAASNTLAPSYWPRRAGALPSGSVVLLLGTDGEWTAWSSGLDAARASDARVVYMSDRPDSRLVKLVDMFVPLPSGAPAAIVGPVMAGTVAEMVRSISSYAGPSGPASPWRAWPHSQKVFLETPGDPTPAILLQQADPPRRRSMVIFYAGLGVTKEVIAPPCTPADRVTPCMVTALLNAGHDVLLPDAPGHGERKAPWEDTSDLFRAGILDEGPDYLEQVRGETSGLISAVLQLGVVSSPAQIAVAGQSAGGMQTILKLAGDPRIACGVAIMPICDITDLTQFSDLRGRPRLEIGGPNRSMGVQLAPRPLLLIGGGQDPTAPSKHIQKFVREITPAYEKKDAADNLSYLHLDDVAHKFDARQVDAMLDWLDRHLHNPAKGKRSAPGKSATPGERQR